MWKGFYTHLCVVAQMTQTRFLTAGLQLYVSHFLDAQLETVESH